MEWYDGTVTEALSLYQEKNGILVVYIHHQEEDNDENTKKLNELWANFDKALFGGAPVTSIRLLKDSEGALQFGQFFPTPIFPVCYIIGLNGQPLEVITAVEPLTSDRLVASVKKSINLYNDQLREKGIKIEGVNTSESRAAAAGLTAVPGESQAELEARIEYARKRLEEKRKEDALKKEEDLRQKELQRRNEGKALLEAAERNKERALKEAVEARKREKLADAATLKALREQIQRDKEDRARKLAGPSAQVEEKPMAPEPVFNKPVDVDECRIQCKFSNGATLVKTFPSKSALQAVVDVVKEDGRQPGEFFLVQTYPRRQLKNLEATLLDLGLTPSSSLLVVPKGGRRSRRKMLLPASNSDSYFSLLLGLFYTPIAAIFRFFYSLFGFGGGNNSLTNGGSSMSRPTSSSDIDGDRRRMRASGSRESVRREGNIGRLRNDSDTSDAEGTWNGNSTQQL